MNLARLLSGMFKRSPFFRTGISLVTPHRIDIAQILKARHKNQRAKSQKRKARR